MNCNVLGRKGSLSNGGTVATFVWCDCGKPRKASVVDPTNILFRNSSDRSPESMPYYYAKSMGS
jgi:hypothetical protein